MITIKFAFKIGENVNILPLERSGRVKALWVSESGIQYQVRYFDNAEARTVYFEADELRRTNNQESGG